MTAQRNDPMTAKAYDQYQIRNLKSTLYLFQIRNPKFEIRNFLPMPFRLAFPSKMTILHHLFYLLFSEGIAWNE
jgi:hypothetical protein